MEAKIGDRVLVTPDGRGGQYVGRVEQFDSVGEFVLVVRIGAPGGSTWVPRDQIRIGGPVFATTSLAGLTVLLSERRATLDNLHCDEHRHFNVRLKTPVRNYVGIDTTIWGAINDAISDLENLEKKT